MGITKVFLTGASGYVGGEALYAITQISQGHQIRCLVRGDEKAKAISTAFPKAEIVKGDLDDSKLVEKEARAADVVFHLASTRHESSSKAIAAGLSDASRQAPGYWVQMSGASMFAGSEIKANKYGEPSDKVYDDVKDSAEILEVIKSSPGRVVDNLVLSQDSSAIKTALIPGPMIYGTGHGPVNTTTIQAPEITRYALKHGQPYMVGKGQAIWSNVHIHDLGKLFTLLLQAASEKREGLWNDNGIYFPENGSMSFGEVAQHIAKALYGQNRIKSEEVKSVSSDEANEIMGHGAILLGTNARLKASRARRDLGWAPSAASLSDDIPVMVKEEAQKVN